MSDFELVFDGVYGTAEYSDFDRRWHGKIIGIDDLVTYEADDYNGLRQSFIDAVVDWRETRRMLAEKLA